MRSKTTLPNIIAYLQGNIRMILYYSRFKFLIREHIREQIDFRIKFMDKECYENGQCKLCGCATTALQMADKACDRPCYPAMMGKRNWRMFSQYCGVYYDSYTRYYWRYDNGKLPSRGKTPPHPEHLAHYPTSNASDYFVVYPQNT